MYASILSEEQRKLLPLVRLFRREFYLVGGTAIALQIGHRMSIDFDLFKATPFNSKRVLSKFDNKNYRYTVTRRVSEQMNLTIQGVKMTFFEYPYPIAVDQDFEKIIRMPSLLSLAAMKAFALGRRSKWKDYVDLYFLLRDFFTVEAVISKATSIYGDEFSGKLFRSQLAYHKDIDYSEKVEYMDGFRINDEDIKTFLIDKALEDIG
jgi:hypothetical protein